MIYPKTETKQENNVVFNWIEVLSHPDEQFYQGFYVAAWTLAMASLV